MRIETEMDYIYEIASIIAQMELDTKKHLALIAELKESIRENGTI